MGFKFFKLYEENIQNSVTVGYGCIIRFFPKGKRYACCILKLRSLGKGGKVNE